MSSRWPTFTCRRGDSGTPSQGVVGYGSKAGRYFGCRWVRLFPRVIGYKNRAIRDDAWLPSVRVQWVRLLGVSVPDLQYDNLPLRRALLLDIHSAFVVSAACCGGLVYEVCWDRYLVHKALYPCDVDMGTPSCGLKYCRESKNRERVCECLVES